ncbi:MAG: hypothetical protein ACO3JG_01960 [Luteolibacter sp.]
MKEAVGSDRRAGKWRVWLELKCSKENCSAGRRDLAGFGGFGGKFIRCERNFANRFAKIYSGKPPRHNPLRMI